MKVNQLYVGKNSTKMAGSLLMLCLVCISIYTKSQSLITDYAVFGGAQNCVGPGQTAPGSLIGISPGCGVHMGVGSVINGNVGSYHIVEANGGVTINGNIYSGGIVNLANSDAVGSITAADMDARGGNVIHTGSAAHISGNLDANGDIFVNTNGSSFVTGFVRNDPFNYAGPLPGGGVGGAAVLPALPVMPAITPFTCPIISIDNVTATRIISPGFYNNMILGNAGGTITFDGPGDYYFNLIDIAQGPTKTFVYDFHGNTTDKINIYVCGDVNLGKLKTQFLNTPSDSCRIFFETHGTGAQNGNTFSFMIGTGSNFFGTVWAPFAAIHVGSGSCCTFVTGHLWSATQVDVQHGVTINTCESPCNTVCINISKQVFEPLCGVDSVNAEPPVDGLWHYYITNNNNTDTIKFDLPYDPNNIVDTFFCDLPFGTYTVTEDTSNVPGWAVLVDGVAGTSRTFNFTKCGSDSVAFTNIARCHKIPPHGCSWCNKSAVLSQVWQNMNGDTCAVPDILVDVRLPHTPDNNVVTANEIHTGNPATWSLQAAVDYVNANGDPTPGDGQIFIGVTASDCDTIPLCGKDSSRSPSGDNPHGTENVIVTNNNPQRLNIFGCSVTIWAADVNKPVITIQNSLGKVTVLDVHVKYSKVAGYLVQNNADLVVVKNSAAWFNDLGYDINDDNVQVTGAQHIKNNRIGILVRGNNNILRTNNDITDNTLYGIELRGNNNESNGNEVGTSGHPNPVGLLVSGNFNNVHDGDFNYNTTDGVVVSGSNNIIKQNDANNNGGNGFKITGNNNTLDGNTQVKNNGGNGIYVTGATNTLKGNQTESNTGHGISADAANGASGNMLKSNTAKNNGQQGIRACGQVDQTGNSGSGNAVDPQVAFVCPTVSKFLVVDPGTGKSYKYDATFNLVVSAALPTSNVNDVANDGANTYVLDKSAKKVYRLNGSSVSKVLKSTGGSSLSTPAGLAIDGNDMWVADASNKILYKYSLSAAIGGSGNINAVSQMAFTALNTSAGGLSIDATNLYVLDDGKKQIFRYPRAGGAATASKVLKDNAGGSLSSPSGNVLEGATSMWVVDNGKDMVYQYAFASLFGAGNLNASAQYALYTSNSGATGIAIGTNATFQRLESGDDNSGEQVLPQGDAVLQVYPNPTHGNITVQFSTTSAGKFQLRVTDLTGRMLRNEMIDATEGINVHEIELGDVAKGTYLLLIENNNLRKQTRIVIE